VRDLGLHPRVVEAAQAVGIETYTLPQVRAIPPILHGKNVLLVAPTGIGKTEAAMLPLFSRLLTEPAEPIALLYVTPLRALNRDMLRRMTRFGELLDLRVAVRHGDTSQKERAALTRSPPAVLITTPETLQIMLTGSRLREQLKNVRHVVIDEIHELAGDERGAQLAVALERLAALRGSEFQRIGLSATVGTPAEVAGYLGGVGRKVETILAPVPKDIELAVELPVITAGDHRIADALKIPPIQAAALRRCREEIAAHRSTLLFVNTRDTAEFLSSRLKTLGETPAVGVHHGSLSRDVRVQMEEDFKAERLQGLICTSSLELGIDIGSADFVLQFNSPREVSRLVQRAGRSGHRHGEVSRALILATNEDDYAEACVITRRAGAAELEALPIRENNLSVLANQLAAMALSEPSLEMDEVHRLLTRSYPFRNLKRVELDAVARQLAEIRTVWYRDGRLGRSRLTRTYFLENISMIPDVRTYRVQDIATRKVIGTLDEWFVAENAREGVTFVMRGTAWRLVEVKEDGLLVSAAKHMGEVPSWVGENIPVPHEVGQEVGALRGALDLGRYPGNAEGDGHLRKIIAGQAPLPVPTDRLITLESGRGLVILNACFGSKVNETLGQLISSLLSARFGQSVGVHTDPYRVVLQVPRVFDPQLVLDILRPADPASLEPLLRVVLRNSAYLRWSFLYVAKKFGAIRREVDWEMVNINRLLQTFENTPLLDEVLDKIFWERMDLPRTAEILGRIRDGEIQVIVTKPSPLGMAGVERGGRLVAPQKPDHATLQALKKRLEGETAHLVCMHCLSAWRVLPRDLPSKVRCPTCEATMVAALGPFERERVKLLKKERLTKEEKAEVKRIYTNASLVSSHGRKAVIALLARGVGPDTAARLLRGMHQDEDEFLKAVLLAELTYARTKRFWD